MSLKKLFNSMPCGHSQGFRSYREVVNEALSLEKLGARISFLGKSLLGREIMLLSVGEGGKRLLIVCRQHGNEPTSTEAMLEYAREMLTERKYRDIIKKVTVSVVPLANPDGAELYHFLCRKGKPSLLVSYMARTRKPYRGDINRDHRKKKSAEARAVEKAVKEVSPHIILDLHNFYPKYEYMILRRPVHNFCCAISTNSKIDGEVSKKNYKICILAMKAVENVSGKPAKINGFWPGFYGRLLMPREDVLDTYYAVHFKIPSVTFEAVGGFYLCSERLWEGKLLHKVAVDAVVKALAFGELD